MTDGVLTRCCTDTVAARVADQTSATSADAVDIFPTDLAPDGRSEPLVDER